MKFFDNFWQSFEQLNSLKAFTNCYFGKHYLKFCFSDFWPFEQIQSALALNTAITNNSDWKIFCVTENEFNFLPIANGFNRDKHGKLEIKDENILAIYDSLNNIFRIYDFKNKYAAIICGNNHKFNEWEIHSPLKEFFHVWAIKNNALLVHSGVVSENGLAALIPGAGGSGKSTTVLSCLQNNMQTTGDDYNLIYKNGEDYFISTLYSNVKLKSDAKISLDIVTNWPKISLDYAAKNIYFPPASSNIWDIKNPKLNGILCPQISSSKSENECKITNIDGTGLINKLAISSIMQTPYFSQEYLSMVVELAKKVRIASLNLTHDINTNYKAIKLWLKSQ
jgi:hypothetical protein